MITHIAQITDIHLGGEYNGFYTPHENFTALIDAIPNDYFVVITGDLADHDHRGYYEEIKNMIEQKFGDKYAVLPGNHDDVNVLDEVFGEQHTKSTVFNMVPISLVPTVHKEGTNNGQIREGTDLDAAIQKNGLVFTHYPVIETTHKFMNKYALLDADKFSILNEMTRKNSPAIFCGHYHSNTFSLHTTTIKEMQKPQQVVINELSRQTIKQYICPASQCQIAVDNDNFECVSKVPYWRSILCYIADDTGELCCFDVQTHEVKK